MFRTIIIYNKSQLYIIIKIDTYNIVYYIICILFIYLIYIFKYSTLKLLPHTYIILSRRRPRCLY